MNKKLMIPIVILALMQMIKPTLNRGEYDVKLDFLTTEKPSRIIGNQLKTSCYDCHSSSTQYPWYNKITPINYWLNNHIKGAKKHINFSDWGKYSVKNKIHILEECMEVLEAHEMPLKSYVWLHKEANLSDSDRKELMIWLQQIKVKYELIPRPM